MFENLGFTELLLIMIIALVVFGPRRLPELGRSLGSALREFKNAVRTLTDEVQKAAVEGESAPAQGRTDPPSGKHPAS